MLTILKHQTQQVTEQCSETNQHKSIQKVPLNHPKNFFKKIRNLKKMLWRGGKAIFVAYFSHCFSGIMSGER